jgi:hypothetical protein
MLYRVLREKGEREIAVVAVSPRILTDKAIFFTDGNAACDDTAIMPMKEAKSKLQRIQKRDLNREYWSTADDSKRRIMAECLVPGFIPADYVNRVFVPNHDSVPKAEELLKSRTIPVTPEPRMFFSPNVWSFIEPNIWLVDGDMFFSKCHTITISVNTVGIVILHILADTIPIILRHSSMLHRASCP